MRRASYPRWAISLADLTLLLLGFSVMLHVAMVRQGAVPHPGAATKATAAAPHILFDEAALPLFAEGEARLTPHARARLKEVGRHAAVQHAVVQIESSGSAAAAARFDRWELTAARAAAVGRALAEGGLAQDRIELAIPSLSRTETRADQRIVIRRA